MSDEKPQASFGEYMGSPTMTIFINRNPSFKFTFGLGKAKAILDYYEDVKKFVEQNEPEKKKEAEKE
ncbi:MAG: hypothetical protein K9J16_07675 [Melioribacteraceae bacterium]|nr:hypothetical protein [Melioribacteraceae bacterium]MCF8353309.1 hypothetical protein [Melioribacteraceae bacterium]MCF8393173.1 hypothetical protein [Melioribacteraceae bacterium]MCF8419034.1 hypothetical protein [Melioribacteraceae bacterium]